MIFVPGRPVPWGMGRETRAGRRLKPERLKVFQEKVAYAWREHCGSLRFPGAVAIRLGILLSTSGRLKIDEDNVKKAVADALKHVAFGDDDLVYSSTVYKQPCRPGEEGIFFAVEPYGGPVDPRHAA